MSRAVGRVAICACLVAVTAGCGHKKKEAKPDADRPSPKLSQPAAPGAAAGARAGEAPLGPAALPGGALRVVDDCPRSLGGTEQVARTIRKACGPIAVTRTYVVDGSLTLEAGAVLKFQPDAELQIGASGPAQLIVRGTARDPVILTSANDLLPSAWLGVRLLAGARGSQLSGLVIEDAGAWTGGGRPYDSDASNAWLGALIVRAEGVRLTDSKIRNAKGYGLQVEASGAFTEMSGNTFEHAGAVAIRIPAGQVGALVNNHFGIGDVIRVDGDTISSDARWQDQGVPYRLTGMITISGKHERATLEIAAGTQLWLDEPFTAAGLTVGGASAGVLVVSGIPERPVVFAREGRQPGSWSGITVTERGEARITSALIAQRSGSAALRSSGRLVVTGTRFETGGTSVAAGGTLVFDHNAIAVRDGPAMRIGPDQVGGLGSNNVFDKDALIEISGGLLKESTTWSPQGVPYRVTGSILTITHATLTLLPGIELVFAGQTTNLTTELRAVGTPDRPITMRWTNADQWNGHLELPTQTASELAHVQLSDTGGKAAIIVRDRAVVRLSDVRCVRCGNAVVTTACHASVTAARITADPKTPLEVKEPCP